MKKITVVTIFLVLNCLLFAQWQAITPAPLLNTGDIHDICFLDGNTGFAAGEGSGKGIILKTTSGGTNWSIIYTTAVDLQWIYSIHFVDNMTGFACGENGAIYSTVNGGLTWASQLMPNCTDLDCIRFVNSTTGMTCGDGDNSNRGPVYKTTNGGLTWAKILNSVYHMDKIFYLDQNNVFASGDYVVYKSSNGGNTWQDIYPGNSDCNDLYFFDMNTGIVCGNYVMLKTTNAGANWTEFLISPSDTNYHATVYFTDNSTGYIPIINLTTFAGKIYKTTNSGANWLLQQSLSGHAKSIKFINVNTGFACGGGAKIWKTTNGGGPIGIQTISNEVPESYTLSQNYPNPFNPTTKIRFGISKTDNVEIKVFDLLGREIAILVNEQLQPGTYEADWVAGNYPSGIYYYKLVSGGFTETKKMVLVK